MSSSRRLVWKTARTGVASLVIVVLFAAGSCSTDGESFAEDESLAEVACAIGPTALGMVVDSLTKHEDFGAALNFVATFACEMMIMNFVQDSNTQLSFALQTPSGEIPQFLSLDQLAVPAPVEPAPIQPDATFAMQRMIDCTTGFGGQILRQLCMDGTFDP